MGRRAPGYHRFDARHLNFLGVVRTVPDWPRRVAATCLMYPNQSLGTSACGQTLNKPPGTKPRNAAARLGWATAYGDLTSAVAPEMADDWRTKLSATQRSTPPAVICATSTSVRGSKLRLYGVEERQAALGTWNSEADTGTSRRNTQIGIMAVLGSAAGAA